MQLQPYEKEHLLRLRALLPECTVLLRSNGAFPLEQAGELALYGNGARNTAKGGTGSGEVNSRYFVTVEQGLREAGFTVTTDGWLDGYDNVRVAAKKQFIQDIKARAREKHTNVIVEGMGAVMPEPEYTLPLDGAGDTAVYVLSRISGEGNDRADVAGDIRLTRSEKRDILALNRQYSRFMLVINAGGPVDLSELGEIGNILVLSQLGVDTGTVLADLLLGRAYPSGKLTTTWAPVGQYCHAGDFGQTEDTCYREGVYVGYRYFDSVGEKPLFPFGFGLSYTTFAVSAENTTVEGSRVTVRATVKNTGSRPGREVVQLYVNVPEGRLDQPWQTLAAFRKTEQLEPGQSRTVELSFDLTQLSSFDTERSAYVLEQGDYVLRLGTSSADTSVCAAVRLPRTVEVRRVRHIGGEAAHVDWKPEHRPAVQLPEGVTVLRVEPETIETEQISYDTRYPIDEQVRQLPDEQLAYLNVGAFSAGMGVLSIIGNASSHVAGAAGETTGMVEGIAPLVMADGPAGLRLSQHYTIDRKGAHAIGETMPATILDFVPAPATAIVSMLNPKPKKNATVYDQYATAIPVGTAVAQSWNLELAKQCGDLVGAEMERFGVHLWLAPALNIHRDIRCGRNFEYFSEDPLLSGEFAAALTLGVQQHPGCGTTIKHFAANNQETNRNGNNSMISERALREIYLRGFEICIRKAQPHALMSSYNLLNGVHTSQRRDLIEDFLRCECGYQGIVMTDWLVASGMLSQGRHAPAKAADIAAAGGDLVMPGGKGDYKSILRGLKDGTVSRQQLLINASRVARLCRALTGAQKKPQ